MNRTGAAATTPALRSAFAPRCDSPPFPSIFLYCFSIPLHFPLFSSIRLYFPLFSSDRLSLLDRPRARGPARCDCFPSIFLHLYSILSRFPSICTPFCRDFPLFVLHPPSISLHHLSSIILYFHLFPFHFPLFSLSFHSILLHFPHVNHRWHGLRASVAMGR